MIKRCLFLIFFKLTTPEDKENIVWSLKKCYSNKQIKDSHQIIQLLLIIKRIIINYY